MKLALLTTLLLLSNLAHSASLSIHSKSVGIKLSSANVGQESYTIVGASINYFVIDNLSVGAAYEYWFSGTPSVSKASLDSTYYLPINEEIKPYAGLLYSRYFIENTSDVDAYGYRAGVAYIKSPMILSAGIKQEKYTSDNASFQDEDPTAEFVVGFSF